MHFTQERERGATARQRIVSRQISLPTVSFLLGFVSDPCFVRVARAREETTKPRYHGSFFTDRRSVHETRHYVCCTSLSQLFCTVDLLDDETRDLGGYNDEKLRNQVFLTVSPSLPIMTPYHPRALSSMTRALCVCVKREQRPFSLTYMYRQRVDSGYCVTTTRTRQSYTPCTQAQVCERDRPKTPASKNAPPSIASPVVQTPCNAPRRSSSRNDGTGGPFLGMTGTYRPDSYPFAYTHRGVP